MKKNLYILGAFVQDVFPKTVSHYIRLMSQIVYRISMECKLCGQRTLGSLGGPEEFSFRLSDAAVPA